MKKCWQILFIALITTCYHTLYAQQTKQLIACVKQGDVSNLKRCMKRVHDKDCSRSIPENLYWQQYQEIIPGYYQAIIFSSECGPATDGVINVTARTIKLLIRDSAIYHYSIDDPYNKSSPYISSKTINTDTYKELFIQYQHTYDVQLDTNELFKSSYFELGVGDDGRMRSEQTEVLKWVATKNFQALDKWLTCPNVTKQLYAMYGYEFLRSKGTAIPKQTERILQLVKQKQGTIMRCLGCLCDPTEIKEVAADISRFTSRK